MRDGQISILRGSAFVVSDRRGDIEGSPTETQGLFVDDTRFLSRWVLTVDGVRPTVLSTEVANNREHTCWFCPRTWRQLVERYGFTIRAIQFDARYAKDRLMPLPRGLKYPAWSLETIRQS